MAAIAEVFGSDGPPVKDPALQGLQEVELAGLEPATSWVRSSDGGADGR